MTKHHLFLLILVILPSISGYAQIDSLPSERIPEEEKYDSVFKKEIMSHESQIDHMWKFNLVNSEAIMPSVGYEVRIGKTWSSETNLTLGIPERNGHYGLYGQWQITQQLKYYFNLNRREMLGRKTNGFSGNYIALNLFAGEYRDPKPDYHSGTWIEGESYYGVGLNFGMQRRIGKIGYFEPYFSISYQFRNLSDYHNPAPFNEFSGNGYYRDWSIIPSIGLKAGFSLESLSDLKNPNADNQTIGQQVRHVWKLNLVGAGILMPNCGFEFRISDNWTSDSYIKYNLQIKLSRQPSLNVFDIYGLSYQDFEIAQQFKYYYNLNHREISGKSTRGFAGNYFSVGLFAKSSGYFYEDYGGYISITNPTTLWTYGGGLKYGLQRRIGNIGYIDIYGGINYQLRQVPEEFVELELPHRTFVTTSLKQGFVPVIGIKAGFAIDSGTKLKNLFK